jgi:hypothetical protein
MKVFSYKTKKAADVNPYTFIDDENDRVAN